MNVCTNVFAVEIEIVPFVLTENISLSVPLWSPESSERSCDSFARARTSTFDALTKMRDSITVAQMRGITLDKVFNG